MCVHIPIILCLCTVLDPALVGLSLAYVGSMTLTLQYVMRVSADLENLVSLFSFTL